MEAEDKISTALDRARERNKTANMTGSLTSHKVGAEFVRLCNLYGYRGFRPLFKTCKAITEIDKKLKPLGLSVFDIIEYGIVNCAKYRFMKQGDFLSLTGIVIHHEKIASDILGKKEVKEDGEGNYTISTD